MTVKFEGLTMNQLAERNAELVTEISKANELLGNTGFMTLSELITLTMSEKDKQITELQRKIEALAVAPDERKTFEQFMEQRFKESMDQRLCKNGDGYYMAWDMNVAWVVWQQRAMLAAAPKPGGANG